MRADGLRRTWADQRRRRRRGMKHAPKESERIKNEICSVLSDGHSSAASSSCIGGAAQAPHAGRGAAWRSALLRPSAGGGWPAGPASARPRARAPLPGRARPRPRCRQRRRGCHIPGSPGSAGLPAPGSPSRPAAGGWSPGRCWAWRGHTLQGRAGGRGGRVAAVVGEGAQGKQWHARRGRAVQGGLPAAHESNWSPAGPWQRMPSRACADDHARRQPRAGDPTRRLRRPGLTHKLLHARQVVPRGQPGGVDEDGHRGAVAAAGCRGQAGG